MFSRGNITEEQEHVSMENLQYHDLIQSDFIDSYNNLTIKTMVIMDWLATRCSLVSPTCPLEVETLVSPTCPLEEETLVSPTCPLVLLWRSPSGTPAPPCRAGVFNVFQAKDPQTDGEMERGPPTRAGR
ncbi:unnamed protein product [Boreogadus saida]